MTKIDLFVQEISLQCEFVLIAATGLDHAVKTYDTKAGLFYVQALLTASANISKLLWAVDGNKQARPEREQLRRIFEITEDSITVSRDMRNHFDHFDERLDTWWETHSHRPILIDTNFGRSVGGDSIQKGDFLRNYDFKTATVHFQGFTFNTKAMAAEAFRIFQICKQYQSAHG